MADETGQAPAQTPPQDGAGAIAGGNNSATTAPATQAVEEEPFDKDRALATISKLREFEKQAKAQEKELASLRLRVKAEEDAKLSETEKREKQLQDLQVQAETWKRERRELLAKSAVISQSQKLGIVDPDAAYTLLANSLQYDENGAPSNVETALKDLIKAKPYLLGAGVSATNAERGAQDGQAAARARWEERNRPLNIYDQEFVQAHGGGVHFNPGK